MLRLSACLMNSRCFATALFLVLCIASQAVAKKLVYNEPRLNTSNPDDAYPDYDKLVNDFTKGWSSNIVEVIKSGDATASTKHDYVVMHGRFANGHGLVTKRVSNLPSHLGLHVKMRFWSIATWDCEWGRIMADGVEIFKMYREHSYCTDGWKTHSLYHWREGAVETAFCYWDVSAVLPAHAHDSVLISFSSNLDEDEESEGYGISDLEVWVDATDPIAAKPAVQNVPASCSAKRAANFRSPQLKPDLRGKVSEPELPTCSMSWCTSSDSLGGYDCWAGSDVEPCSCSKGQAKETGKKLFYDGKWHYEYTCCTDGTGTGEQCGDCCTPLPMMIGLIIGAVACIGGYALGLCLYCCHARKCCCFRESRDLSDKTSSDAFIVGLPVMHIDLR